MAKAKTSKSKGNGKDATSDHGIDLNELDRDGLLQLRKDVDRALQNYEKLKRDEALREMEQVAKRHGMSLKDFIQSGGPRRGINAPKFRHPENPELTWSGRGRQPTWYKEAVEAGVDPEDLKI